MELNTGRLFIRPFIFYNLKTHNVCNQFHFIFPLQTANEMQQKQYGVFSLPVIVGALGFFVDIYDLLLFNIVRIKSFADLGVAESAMKNIGEKTISLQMLGLAIGGIIWGIL